MKLRTLIYIIAFCCCILFFGLLRSATGHSATVADHFNQGGKQLLRSAFGHGSSVDPMFEGAGAADSGAFSGPCDPVLNERPWPLVILIMSARENFEKRSVQRATWVGWLRNHAEYRDKAVVRFVVGARDCVYKSASSISTSSSEEGSTGAELISPTELLMDCGDGLMPAVKPLVAAALTDEQRAHGDLLVVNTVDVYGTVPLKVLKSHALLDQCAHPEFQYVLKTDDDSWISPAQLLRALAALPRLPAGPGFDHNKDEVGADATRRRTSFDDNHPGAVRLSAGQGGEASSSHLADEPGRGLVWSLFEQSYIRQHTDPFDVRHYDAVYSADEYPAVPSGTGYVLSADLSRWLGQPAQQDALYSFNGEDVSIGIWFSAIAPRFLHDTRWRRMQDPPCSNNMLSYGNLRPRLMHRLYESYQICSQPCNCDFVYDLDAEAQSPPWHLIGD